MSNHYFQFKQFRIEQSDCAMKVSTDACIQGVVAANYFKNKYEICGDVLDIGSGTGLLTLMLAQVLQNCNFTALEKDQSASIQSAHNFDASKWKERLQVENSALQEFANITERKFDLIICNPPFFTGHLNASNYHRNIARHNDTLPPRDLARCVSFLLKKEGIFCVMYSCNEWDTWDKEAMNNKLNLQFKIEVRSFKDSVPHRIIGFYGPHQNGNQEKDVVVIYDNKHTYTSLMRELLQPYYLNL